MRTVKPNVKLATYLGEKEMLQLEEKCFKEKLSKTKYVKDLIEKDLKSYFKT